MTPTTDNPAKAAIQAILREAEHSGVRGVVRTSLIKYLYLLDLFVARETNGLTYTGATWRFHHFGPYADILADELDNLAQTPSVDCLQGGGQSKDYSIYKLGGYGIGKSLEELGLSFDVRNSLSNTIRQFAGDLAGLLNYVYFHTEPMAEAKPGDILSFQTANKPEFKRDIRTITVPVKDQKKLERMKGLLRKLGENWESRAKSHSGKMTAPVRDQHYTATLADDDLAGVTGRFKGRLFFEGDA
jgi:hypothetical protein